MAAPVEPQPPLRLNTTGVMPPGGYRYFVGDTATWLPPHGKDPYVAFDDLLSAVTAHLKANAKPIPPNLGDLIQQQICERLDDPAWCNRGSPLSSAQVAAHRRGWSFTFNQVVAFTATMADWFAHGKRRVADSDIAERAAVCSACQHNVDPPGCSACNMKSLLAVAARVVGGQPHPSDAKLHSCAICGCNLRAKVRIPTDVLLRHMDAATLDRLPEHCWLARARAEEEALT